MAGTAQAATMHPFQSESLSRAILAQPMLFEDQRKTDTMSRTLNINWGNAFGVINNPTISSLDAAGKIFRLSLVMIRMDTNQHSKIT